MAWARVMRRVLVDHARQHRARKRDGSWSQVSFDDVAATGEPRSVDMIALEEALEALVERDADKVRLVELRFFGGLSLDETARAWLFRRLKGGRRDRVAAGRRES